MISVSACLLFSLVSNGQQLPPAKRYIPRELEASDPEIRTLLASAESKSDAGEYDDAFADSKAALELAEKKGLLGDRELLRRLSQVGMSL